MDTISWLARDEKNLKPDSRGSMVNSLPSFFNKKKERKINMLQSLWRILRNETLRPIQVKTSDSADAAFLKKGSDGQK